MKLTYFNLKGRAEFARLVLAQAGQEFEDVRIDQVTWPINSIFVFWRYYRLNGQN